MTQSPIEQLCAAIDDQDLDAAVSLFEPDGRLLGFDGQRAEGRDAIHELFGILFAELQSSTHRVTAQWHEHDVWIGEVDVDYELQDGTLFSHLRRAVVARIGPSGFADVHAYGAHEQPLGEQAGEQGIAVGGRWMPPL